jgi:hypothetical protein
MRGSKVWDLDVTPASALVLEEFQFDDWMRGSPELVAGMVKPYGRAIKAWEVRTEVGNTKNNRPELIRIVLMTLCVNFAGSNFERILSLSTDMLFTGLLASNQTHASKPSFSLVAHCQQKKKKLPSQNSPTIPAIYHQERH